MENMLVILGDLLGYISGAGNLFFGLLFGGILLAVVFQIMFSRFSKKNEVMDDLAEEDDGVPVLTDVADASPVVYANLESMRSDVWAKRWASAVHQRNAAEAELAYLAKVSPIGLKPGDGK